MQGGRETGRERDREGERERERGVDEGDPGRPRSIPRSRVKLSGSPDIVFLRLTFLGRDTVSVLMRDLRTLACRSNTSPSGREGGTHTHTHTHTHSSLLVNKTTCRSIGSVLRWFIVRHAT